MKITITDLQQDGVTVAFPKDAATIASLKARFPKARWNATWLWHIIYDGSDGATWGDYNCGRNTRGSRTKATPELINAIKGHQR